MTEWRVPLSDVDLSIAEIEAITEVIRSRWLTMGPRTEEFERVFARFCEVEYAIAVTNCTAALHLAYVAIGLGPGDEIIMPAMTFVATANAAVACGARPVFADIISEDEPTINPDHIASLITSRTRAIAVVHYAGYACRMDEIMRVADQHNLPVIEDCAHAPGVRYNGQSLGTLGASGCFSFFSNKNMTTGEGGMIITRNEQFATRLRLLRSHGMSSGTWRRHNERPQDYDVVEVGWNYRIDELRSAIGLVQLAKLMQANARRIELTARYRRMLSGVSFPLVAFEDYTGESACHILPLVTSDSAERQTLVAALTAADVQTSHHYLPVHLFQLYRERFGYRSGMLPHTESFAAKEITLPLYPKMRDGDVDYVAEVIRSAAQGKASWPCRMGGAA